MESATSSTRELITRMERELMSGYFSALLRDCSLSLYITCVPAFSLVSQRSLPTLLLSVDFGLMPERVFIPSVCAQMG